MKTGYGSEDEMKNHQYIGDAAGELNDENDQSTMQNLAGNLI